MNVTTISKVRPEPTAQARGPLVSQVLGDGFPECGGRFALVRMLLGHASLLFPRVSDLHSGPRQQSYQRARARVYQVNGPRHTQLRKAENLYQAFHVMF